jgi:hypothetical protein
MLRRSMSPEPRGLVACCQLPAPTATDTPRTTGRSSDTPLDQPRDQRGQRRRSAILATVRPLDPVRSEELLGWAAGLGAGCGCGPWSVVRGGSLAPGPLGSVAGARAGDPGRRRGWPLPPPPIPRTRTGGWQPGAEAARVLGSLGHPT